MTTISSDTGLVFSWKLPPLALPGDVMVNEFTVMGVRDGGGQNFSSTVTFSGDRSSLQGAVANDLEPGTTYQVTLTADYSSPMVTSPVIEESFTTLSQDEGTGGMGQEWSRDPVCPSDTLCTFTIM